MTYGSRTTSSARARDVGELRRNDRERITVAVLAGGASLEAGFAGLAIVLALVGLAGVAARYVAPLAALAIGCGAFVAGAAVASRWKGDVARVVERVERVELAGGLGADVLGGSIGAVLAIVALAGFAPLVLLPTAALVFGIARLLGGAVRPRVAALVYDADRTFERRVRLAIETTTTLVLVIALASIVLGVLGLVGVVPRLLSLVSSLGLGIAMLLEGGAETVRFAHRFGELN